MVTMLQSLMPKDGAKRTPSPGDALQLGTHSSLRTSSQHKRMVSSVLHLKKESIGHKGKQTAFGLNAKAFRPPHLKVGV